VVDRIDDIGARLSENDDQHGRAGRLKYPAGAQVPLRNRRPWADIRDADWGRRLRQATISGAYSLALKYLIVSRQPPHVRRAIGYVGLWGIFAFFVPLSALRTSSSPIPYRLSAGRVQLQAHARQSATSDHYLAPRP